MDRLTTKSHLSQQEQQQHFLQAFTFFELSWIFAQISSFSVHQSICGDQHKYAINLLFGLLRFLLCKFKLDWLKRPVAIEHTILLW